MEARAKRLNTWCLGGVPSWWKQMRQRIRRAKDRQAMRRGDEPPKWKHDDIWDWW